MKPTKDQIEILTWLKNNPDKFCNNFIDRCNKNDCYIFPCKVSTLEQRFERAKKATKILNENKNIQLELFN